MAPFSERRVSLNARKKIQGGNTVLQARSLAQTLTTNLYRLISGKAVLRFAAVCMFSLVTVAQSFAAPKNLVAGVGPLSSATKWDGRTAMSVIPGASLFATTSKTTALYIAFTGGTQADIGGMVLYQTDSRNPTITSVTPVTLNKVSNPSINLLDTTICPDQPVSETTPCIVRLDQLKVQLLPSSDYYLAIFFTSPDSNNAALSLSKPRFGTTGLTGFISFTDETKHLAGDTLNNLTNAGTPLGLIAVMNK
jgi:hypothetical protein